MAVQALFSLLSLNSRACSHALKSEIKTLTQAVIIVITGWNIDGLEWAEGVKAKASDQE